MKTAARLLTVLLFVSAAACLAFGLLSYLLLRSALDRLARDSSLELFTPALAGFLQPAVLALGLVLLAAALACALRPDWALKAAAFPRVLAADGGDFLRRLARLRLSRLEWAGLALALAAGAWVRLVLLRGPMLYDESYTWVAFASRSFGAALTDYHLPNNHILHTLLVRFSALLFGSAPWALRLPAFTAGVLMIPAAWLAGRACFSRGAGILAAALTAAWPYLVEYSANARGYTLTGLFTLLLFALIPTLLARRSAFAWLLAALFSALGLFSVPVMLYPVGIFFTALLLSAARGRHKPAWTWPAFLAALAACGLAIGLLTFLFYLPVLVISGPAALFSNPFVYRHAWAEWVAHLGEWGAGIFGSWITGAPAWVWVPLFLLAGVSLVRVETQNLASLRRPVHPLIAAALFFAVVLPLQRPELQAKAFFNVVPLLLLCAAAGFDALITLARANYPSANPSSAVPVGADPCVHRSSPLPAPSSLLTLPLLALCVWCLLQARPNLPYLLTGDKGAWQTAAEYVAARVRPGDAVLITFPFDPQVWYYGNRSGIPMEAFHRETFDRAWVLASKPLAADLRELGEGQIDPLRPEDCRLEADVMHIPIYLCQRAP